MILNIRGTHGSGKSHLVRQLLRDLSINVPLVTGGDGRLIGYRDDSDRLRVLGKYKQSASN